MQSMLASVRAALSHQPGPRVSTAAPPAVDSSSRIAPCGSLRLPFRGVGVGAAPRLPLPPLVGLGANAVRTWGVDQLDESFLRECAAHGVAVFAGLWINSSADGDGGVAAATAAVRRWGSLPVGEAIAAWVVGNEVELREAGGPAAAWRYIARVAAAVRASDPLARPLATAIADVAGGKAAAAAAAAGVDFLLINAYGGAASLPERLAAQGFTGAYALGEYGPEGQWEAQHFQPTQPEPVLAAQSPRRFGFGARPTGAGVASPQAPPASPRNQGLRRALGRILPDAASGIAGGLGRFGGMLGSAVGGSAAGSIAGGLSSGLGASSAGAGTGSAPSPLPLRLPPGQGIAIEQSSGHKAATSLRAYAANLGLAPVPPSGDDTAASGAIDSVPGRTAVAAAVWRALAVAGMRGSTGRSTCVGAFLFFGGAKTEAGATGTWYSLLLTPAAARCAHWMNPRPVADRLAVNWLLWRATPPGAAAAAAGLSVSSGYTPRHSLMGSAGSGSGGRSSASLSLGDVLMQGAGTDPLAAVAAICSLARVPCALGVAVQLAGAAGSSGATTFIGGSSLRAAVVLPPQAASASSSLPAPACVCDWTLERLRGQAPAGSGAAGGGGGPLAAGLALLSGAGGGGAGQPPLVATFQRVPGTTVDFPAPMAAAADGPAIYRLTAFLRYAQAQDQAERGSGSSSHGVGGTSGQSLMAPSSSSHPIVGWFEARPDALAALVRDCAWLARDGVAAASALFAVV